MWSIIGNPQSSCKIFDLEFLKRVLFPATNIIVVKSVQNKTDLVFVDSSMGDIESFRNSWREGNF